MTAAQPSTYQRALAFREAGLSVIPVGKDKVPTVPWTQYQTTPAAVTEIKHWFNNGYNNDIGIVMGMVSGGVELIDFDVPEKYEQWRGKVGLLTDGLVVQRTGSGGYHVIYRRATPNPNLKLAWVKDDAEDTGRSIAIETRGEGGYGKVWQVIQGDLTNIPTISDAHADALLNAGRDLDEAPYTRQQEQAMAKREAEARAHAYPRDGQSAIAAYNVVHPIDEMLSKHGYRNAGGRWVRPNGHSLSITIREGKSFHHSTNDPLNTGYWIDPFTIYCQFEHGGDVKAAVKAAASELGLTSTAKRSHAKRSRDDQAGDNTTEPSEAVNAPLATYVVHNGAICAVQHDREGNPYNLRLCNFNGTITEDMARDDGQDVVRRFTIAGTLDTGQPLPVIRVDGTLFATMNWVMSNWGVRAVVRAGSSAKDKLREAIQVLSADAKARHVFTHTGWRDIDGQRVYLTATGAVGRPDIDTELDGPLVNYALPPAVTDVTEVREAMAASLRMLYVAPLAVTFPLWAAAYLAPLTEILNPDFVLWPLGPSGNLKTTLAQLALGHYGSFAERSHLPATWESTDNALEKLAFLVKDALLLIDDFAPQSSGRDAQDLQRKAARLVRAVGNRSGRDRMRSDTSLRAAYRPRGVVISTGEQLPTGQSVLARVLALEVHRSKIDIEKLSAAQVEAKLYPVALAGYVTWLAPQWDNLTAALPAAWVEIRDRMRKSEHHLRLPEMFASIYLAADVALSFAVEIGATSQSEADAIRQGGENALSQLAKEQAERVLTERPTTRFLSVIGELVAQRKACLMPYGGSGGFGERLGDGEQIGWFDTDFVYLLSDASYHVVAHFMRDENNFFPVNSTTLHRMLAEEGVLVPGEDGRKTVVIKQDGRARRVLKLSRDMAEL